MICPSVKEIIVTVATFLEPTTSFIFIVLYGQIETRCIALTMILTNITARGIQPKSLWVSDEHYLSLFGCGMKMTSQGMQRAKRTSGASTPLSNRKSFLAIYGIGRLHRNMVNFITSYLPPLS